MRWDLQNECMSYVRGCVVAVLKDVSEDVSKDIGGYSRGCGMYQWMYLWMSCYNIISLWPDLDPDGPINRPWVSLWLYNPCILPYTFAVAHWTPMDGF